MSPDEIIAKTCFKCCVRQPVTEYYRHAQMADGHLNKCKSCTKKDASARVQRLANDSTWRRAERERSREKYHRLYSTIEHRAAASRRSRSKRMGPNWTSPSGDAKRKKYATTLLRRAIAAGKIEKRSACEDCGARGKLHGHHEDYDKPLEAVWLCPRCHRRRHAVHPERVRST